MMLPLFVKGQNLDDALRYSKVFYQGTARFNAMGGAFTALGGDISSVALNPAAAAVFRSTEFSITPALVFRYNNTNFDGYNNDYTSSDINLGQIGLVSAVTFGKGDGLTGLSVVYTYNKTNNFNTHTLIDGISSSSSMADAWASQADGYNTWDLGGAPYMAYESWLIDTLSGSFTQYGSIFSYYGETDPVYGQRISRTIDNGGYTGEHTFAAGANIANKLYLGAGFGITSLRYTGHYTHTEVDADQQIFDFVDFTYTDHFQALGSGWNFKLGAIFRPIESLRIGLSVTTPTIYRINEVFYSNLSAFLDNDTPNDVSDDANPLVEQDQMTYSYRIVTPYHINTGIAFQLGSFAILSADYEFVDYAKARLTKGVDGYDFNAENEELKAELGTAGNLRLGAEFRLGSLYLRGGFQYYGSSFRDGTLNESSHYTGLSGGIGYRQDRFYIDLAMSGLLHSENYMMYQDPWLNPVSIDMRDKYLSVTLGLKF